MARILIVEDDTFLLKMYSKKFEVEGFAVETALDGEEGVMKVKTLTPDLIIMDIMLPKLNGLDAISKIKADPAISKIPILVLTNLSTTDDAGTAVARGAEGVLIKSDVTPSQVIARVKEILKI